MSDRDARWSHDGRDEIGRLVGEVEGSSETPKFSLRSLTGEAHQNQASFYQTDALRRGLQRMRGHTATTLSPWQRAGYATARPPATSPPQPRPWKPVAPSERVSRHPEQPEAPKPKKKSLVQRLFSLRSEEPNPHQYEPKDPARGAAASLRVVREGILDPRYRPAARRVTAIICALPLAVYLSYELFQRRFMGKEQKIRPVKKGAQPETETEGAT